MLDSIFYFHFKHLIHNPKGYVYHFPKYKKFKKLQHIDSIKKTSEHFKQQSSQDDPHASHTGMVIEETPLLSRNEMMRER